MMDSCGWNSYLGLIILYFPVVKYLIWINDKNVQVHSLEAVRVATKGAKCLEGTSSRGHITFSIKYK